MIAKRAPWGAFPFARGGNPWKVFEALQQEVQSALEGWSATQDSSVRLSSQEGAVLVEIDAPGLSAEAFDIAPAGQKLLIQFESKGDSPEGARPLQIERGSRPVRYEVTLPFAVSVEAIDAAYDKGI